MTSNKIDTNEKMSTLQLYEKIESIKSTISMANGDRPELWIQRQNLQDLYHQIMLNDINFTIDKKIEQDLWNFGFKAQINYFQTQIKENSLSLNVNNNSSGNNNSGGNSIVTPILDKAPANPQKKAKAQASLSFFLEAARGFYTKLLEDIVLAYDLTDIKNDNKHIVSNSFPFCQTFISVFEKINSVRLNKDSEASSNMQQTKEKQVLYICQHILTHLGDIARYANLFQQAKNYYMHSIKLVPYLGHPYNQLGILFDSSRTNQLSTVFYYIRSIGTRYTFPLASTNLENFFHKLIDIPLNRYNPSAKTLPHKELITLYLQINGIIYSCLLNNKLSRSQNCAKLPLYFDLFKTSFNAFMHTPPLQRDKLDCIQLNQMITILMYVLTLTDSSASKTGNINKSMVQNVALELFVYFIEQFIYFYKNMDELILPSLNLAFSFIEVHQEGQFAKDLVLNNKIWLLSKSESSVQAKFCQATVDFLNNLSRDLSIELDKVNKTDSNDLELIVKFSLKNYADYPLSEDRMLDGFIPLKNSHKDYSFKNYMKNSQLLSETYETLIRKHRILSCFKRILSNETKIETVEKETSEVVFSQKSCFISLSEEKFRISPGCVFLQNLLLNTTSTTRNENNSSCLIKEDDQATIKDKLAINLDEIEKKSDEIITKTVQNIDVKNQSKPESEQQPRKRRQNVAMSSLLNGIGNNQQQSRPNQDNTIVNSTSNLQINNNVNFNIPLKNNTNIIFPNGVTMSGLSLAHSNNSTTTSSSPSPSLSTSSNSSNNEHLFLKNSLTNSINNNKNDLSLNLLNHQNQQQSFFPSASLNQLSQQNWNNITTNTNFPSFNELNQQQRQQNLFNNQGYRSLTNGNVTNNDNILNNNGFPSFLPTTNFQPNLLKNNLADTNTMEKINQLNKKMEQHVQHQVINNGQDIQSQQSDLIKSNLQLQQQLQSLMKNQMHATIQDQNLHKLQAHLSNYPQNNFTSFYETNKSGNDNFNGNTWPQLHLDQQQLANNSNVSSSEMSANKLLLNKLQNNQMINEKNSLWSLSNQDSNSNINLLNNSNHNSNKLNMDLNIANNLFNLSNLSLNNSNDDMKSENIFSKLLIQQLLDNPNKGINQSNNVLNQETASNGQSSIWSFPMLVNQQQNHDQHDSRHLNN